MSLLTSMFICASKNCQISTTTKRTASMLLLNTRRLLFDASSHTTPTSHRVLVPTSYSSSVASLTLSLTLSISSTEDQKRIPVPNIPSSAMCYQKRSFCNSHRRCDKHNYVPNEMSETQYDGLAEVTLNSLFDFFDVLPEMLPCADEYDSELGSGVLTVHFNKAVGTYVINKQTPNKQIWLSSPKTGPKRYDFCGDKWIYRHDGVGLHQLLEEEISEIFGGEVSLKDCKHYS